jgi:uncharacterized protein involved in exopolysaccharide biosynthesis
MNVFQFLRILWAYRLIVAAFAAVALLGAVAFVQIATPQYEAQSRVMLDIVKPDPVTGQVISSPFIRAYTKTQIELVKDYQAANRVVEYLKWQESPEIQAWYRSRDRDNNLTLQQWAAQKIVDGTSARLIEGSNILEITYTSTSPERAKEVSEALRKAYMDMALESRQEAATRNAQWYEDQAEKARGLLLQAEKTKADFERETGIILQDGEMDLEAARLQALAGQGAAPVFATPAGAATASDLQLAQLDAEIAQASKVFGPNHPQLIDMRRRREVLAAQAARERDVGGAAAAAAASAARAAQGMIEAQKAKVVAQREQVERLRLLQADVNLRRDQYNQAATRAAQLRQEAEISVAGATPLGAAVTPQAPVFPDKPLVLGGSIPAGIGLGLMVALLMEIFGRRVRGPDDLSGLLEAPVLGIIRGEKPKRRSWREHLRMMWKRPALKPQSARA